MEVFEFGCGTGTTAIYHAPYVKKISAIDASGKMIEIAQARARAKSIDNVSFVVGDIEDYKVVNGGHDVVMAHSILHLLKDKDQVLAKIHAMLKPGGIFVSSTMCVGDSFIGSAIGTAVSLVAYTGLLPYINIFTGDQLVDSIKQAGFAIEHQWRPKAMAALFLIARKT